MVVLDVVVAWALYRVFRPVNHQLSRIAAWLRVVYAGALAVAIGQLVGVLGLLIAFWFVILARRLARREPSSVL